MTPKNSPTLSELDALTLDEAGRLPREVREVLLDATLSAGRKLLGPQIARQTGLFSDYFEEDLTRLHKLRAVRLHCSGFIPVDERGEVPTLDPRGQFTLVFDNIRRALDRMGTRPDRVVNLMICLKNMDYWGEMNAVYREYFRCAPTRATIGVAALNLNYQIEVANLVAYRLAG